MSRLGFQPEDIGSKTGSAVASNGTHMVSGAGVKTGNFSAFVVLDAATTVTAFTDTGETPAVILTSALPLGTFCAANGVFTSVTLGGGSVNFTRAV